MSIVQDLGSDTTDVSGEVALTWSDLRSDETGYQVQYRLTPSGPWSNGLTFAAGSTGGTQTGLEASTLYYFQVKALVPGTSFDGVYSGRPDAYEKWYKKRQKELETHLNGK